MLPKLVLAMFLCSMFMLEAFSCPAPKDPKEVIDKEGNAHLQNNTAYFDTNNMENTKVNSGQDPKIKSDKSREAHMMGDASVNIRDELKNNRVLRDSHSVEVSVELPQNYESDDVKRTVQPNQKVPQKSEGIKTEAPFENKQEKVIEKKGDTDTQSFMKSPASTFESQNPISKPINDNIISNHNSVTNVIDKKPTGLSRSVEQPLEKTNPSDPDKLKERESEDSYCMDIGNEGVTNLEDVTSGKCTDMALEEELSVAVSGNLDNIKQDSESQAPVNKDSEKHGFIGPLPEGETRQGEVRFDEYLHSDVTETSTERKEKFKSFELPAQGASNGVNECNELNSDDDDNDVMYTGMEELAEHLQVCLLRDDPNETNDENDKLTDSATKTVGHPNIDVVSYNKAIGNKNDDKKKE